MDRIIKELKETLEIIKASSSQENVGGFVDAVLLSVAKNLEDVAAYIRKHVIPTEEE
jgi:hypothetical protein